MQYDIPALINTAIAALKKGNLAQADAISHTLLDLGVKHSIIFEILGHVATSVNRNESALDYFQAAIDENSENQSAIKSKRSLENALEENAITANSADSYLLIKSWGYGFWADIDHVLGQLLLAEITSRTPVVHWSNSSLYSDGSNSDAFELYFKPVSSFTIDDLLRSDHSFFPPKWSIDNIYDESVNKFSGQYSRMAGLYYLNRPENVLVSDFHTYISDLMHWIPLDHHLYGEDGKSIYRYLFEKYLKLQPVVEEEIECFYKEYLSTGNHIAVHVRGSDKLLESKDLFALNASYHDVIDKFLGIEPDVSIFLLTDYEPVIKEYNERYPGKVITTQCARTDNSQGVHYQFQNRKVKNGVEVVKDAYLAAKCKYFIGNGRSNVSTSILHMKNWDSDHIRLLADNILYEPHFHLHNR